MKPLLSLLLLLAFISAKATEDSLLITVSKTTFEAKDTIEFQCTIPSFGERHLATATLNVWIESLEDKKVWKFRYPVINGKAEAALSINDSIRPGKYAMNFILQEGLFGLEGNLRNNYSYKKLNYLMLTQARESFFNDVELNENGDFKLKNLVFKDEAYFIFTPGGKKKNNDLFISLVSPIDSFFIPRAMFTQVINVKLSQQQNVNAGNNYHFDFNKVYTNTTLPDVVVTAKAKTKVKEYEKQFMTSQFGNASRTFDGLDDNAIANSSNLGTFLQGRIPGFRVDAEGRWIWRNKDVTLFIDEYQVDETELVYVNNDDIAMIKFYQPPTSMTQGDGAVVAIYTKKGADENSRTRRYRFRLKGYTPIESEWK